MTKAETALANVLAEVLKANARMAEKLKVQPKTRPVKVTRRSPPIVVVMCCEDGTCEQCDDPAAYLSDYGDR